MLSTRDQALIEECLNGRTAAFEELIRPYQDRLYNTLYRLLGQREEAAELLQESLLRAYRGLQSYQGEASFYTWLYRIAMNVVSTNRRRQRAYSLDRPAQPGQGADDLPDRKDDSRPGRKLELDERRAQIEAALASIPELFRVVLVLKDIEGLKYEEIAEILDVPIGTIRSRLHRARSEMRDRLKPLLDQGIL